MEKNRYHVVKSGYLADGLSFLGFRYQKFGYGKETEYTFRNTEKFRECLRAMLDMKKDVNIDGYRQM